MERIIDKIINKENLLWAWNKTSNAYTVGDIWFDTLELASFKANLDDELNCIADEISRGVYELQPIEPIPFPKKPKYDENDKISKTRIRQSFYIAVRDQVTWMAVVNVIGPALDYRMPSWSYGNRLHRSVWYDPQLKIGWYRSSNKNFFRVWRQSWPLYRHSIGLTIKAMTNNKTYSVEELKQLDANENSPTELKLQYLVDNYWTNVDSNELYWMGIDLEKFYPNVNLDVIKEQILENKNWLDFTKFEELVVSLLTFRIRIDCGWSNKDLDDIDIDRGDIIFSGLPTGLFVAGFLANVAMLKVDRYVNDLIVKDKQIAVFRYVDDHVILGRNAEDILNWVLIYKEILSASDIGVSFNSDKTEPKEFCKALDNYMKSEISRQDLLDVIKTYCRLDPEYPVPLMTQTLAKVSNIADSDIEFLTETEEKQLLADLEHLLLTDFPDHELRCDTRVSFASNMLARIMSNKRIDYTAIYLKRKELYSKIRSICKENTMINCDELYSKYVFQNKATAKPKTLSRQTDLTAKINTETAKIIGEINTLEKTIQKTLFDQKMHIFRLILKSVKENHDKVKLWRRVIDYGYNTQITKDTIMDVFFTIDEIVQCGVAHKLSAQYLYSSFALVLSDRMMKAIGIISNDDSNSRHRQKADIFLNACLELKLVNTILKKELLSNMTYYRDSFNIYKASLGSAHLIMGQRRKSLLRNNRILNWEGNPSQWFVENNMNSHGFLSLLLFRVNSEFKINLNDKWYFFEKNIDSQSLLPTSIAIESSKKENYVNLFEWMDWCKNYALTNSFDLRLSEWMAIRIIRRCIELDCKNQTTIFPDEYDHVVIRPERYLLPKDWVSPNFAIDLKGAIFENITTDDSILEKDENYTPSAIVKSYQKQSHFYKLYGYAVLLNQLLYRDYEFPWIWRLKNFNVLYPRFITARSSCVAVSSFTHAVISSCLRSRSRESFSIQYIFEKYSGVNNDYVMDPPMITSISSLIRYLDIIEAKLKCNMISVKDGQYRQLTPIFTAEITNSNNLFVENEK